MRFYTFPDLPSFNFCTQGKVETRHVTAPPERTNTEKLLMRTEYRELSSGEGREKEPATYIAAKEATHSRNVVPKPKLPSLIAWLTSFLAAKLSSCRSEPIRSLAC